MKRKNLFSIFAAATILSATLSSCQKGEPIYYDAVFATVAMPTTLSAEIPAYPYYFITDDSVAFCPVNTAQYASYNPNHNDRVILLFNDAQTKGDKYKLINIVGLEDVLTKGVVSSNTPEEYGTDKISPTSIWYSGGVYGVNNFVNIEFRYPASNNGIIHSVNLVKTHYSVEEGGEELGNYLYLEFRHDAKGDVFSGNYYQGVASFPLSQEEIITYKGLKIMFDTIDKGEKIYTIDFKNPTAGV